MNSNSKRNFELKFIIGLYVICVNVFLMFNFVVEHKSALSMVSMLLTIDSILLVQAFILYCALREKDK